MNKKIIIVGLLAFLTSFVSIAVYAMGDNNVVTTNAPLTDTATVEGNVISAGSSTSSMGETTETTSSSASSETDLSSTLSETSSATETKHESKPTSPPKQETPPSKQEPVKNINLSNYKEIHTYDTLSEKERDVLSVIFSLYDEYKQNPSGFKNEWTDVSIDMNEFLNICSYLCFYYGEVDTFNTVVDFYEKTNQYGEHTCGIRINPEQMDKYEKRKQQWEAKADKILSSMKEGSEIEKLNQIARYLTNNVRYTDGYYDTYNALINGRGVCNSFAFSFQMLANKLGIPCDFIVGDKNGGTTHAYNRVRLSNGEYCYYDITYYKSTGNASRYINAKNPPFKEYRRNSFVYRSKFSNS